jgi:hypothetical protein
MTILSLLCNKYAGRGETKSSSRKLSSYSSGLLLCYAISTLFGGYLHMTYGRDAVSELNAHGFRFSWTITVGFVSIASAFMGLIGREVQIVYGMRDARCEMRCRWDRGECSFAAPSFHVVVLGRSSGLGGWVGGG